MKYHIYNKYSNVSLIINLIKTSNTYASNLKFGKDGVKHDLRAQGDKMVREKRFDPKK